MLTHSLRVMEISVPQNPRCVDKATLGFAGNPKSDIMGDFLEVAARAGD